jgi:hypothetical protein
MGTRLAGINRDMNIDQYCTDAVAACALASTTLELAPGQPDLRNPQPMTEPAVRSRGYFWATAVKLVFESGDWTIENVGQRPVPIVNLPRCQRRRLSTQRLC